MSTAEVAVYRPPMRPKDIFKAMGVIVPEHEARQIEIERERLFPDGDQPFLAERLRRTFTATVAFRLKGYAAFQALNDSPLSEAVIAAQEFAEKLLARRKDPTSQMVNDFARTMVAASRIDSMTDDQIAEQAFGSARPRPLEDTFGRPVRSFLSVAMSEAQYRSASRLADGAEAMQRAGINAAPVVCKTCNGERFVERDQEIENYGTFAVRKACPDCAGDE